MRALSFLVGGLLVTALVAGAQAANPADPGAPVKANRYKPVTAGTKSYRPVAPLPWGDVNKRVMPKQAPQGKQGAPSEPQHKH
jgi:hypothetical protein